MRSLLLRVLLVMGIGANIALLLINLRPDRPHLQRRRTVRILLRCAAKRAEWLKQNALADFGAQHEVDFDVVLAKNFEEVMTRLQAERTHPTGLLLAAINDEIGDEIAQAGLVRPMQDFIPPDRLKSIVAEYVPEGIERARRADGKLWFLPKRAEIDIAGFLRPAVEEAYLHWEADRPAIQAALAEANGVGLPKGYVLERTPDAWDSYDLFVAAWYWAHHPAPWAPSEFAEPAPRIAFRGGKGSAAVTDLLTAFYRHGLRDEDIGKVAAPAIWDALQWEALLRKHHLLVLPGPDGKLGPGHVNDLFRQRRCAWAPMDQEGAIGLHGGSRIDAEPGITDPQDLDWALLPAGVSLELKNGEPARTGHTYSFQEMQLWAVPARSPDPRLAVRLARFLTQRAIQRRETEAQGLLPIRRDLQAEYPILFRLEWMQRILDTSYRQVTRGSGDVPDEVVTRHYDELYTRLRARVVEERPATQPLTLAAIRTAVEEASHGK